MLALGLVVVSIGTFFYLRGQAIAEVQAELQAIREHQERIVDDNEELRVLLGRRDDPEFIEYLARRELGLILPGEEKYILVESAP